MVVYEKNNATITSLKMGKDVAVANAGDLSRGPFFQPLYASLNTLECLTIYPFNVNDYYILFQEGSVKEKTVLSLEEQFLKYLESNNLSERTIDRYYKQTPNKSEVKAIIKETFNKNSLFEIDSVEDAIEKTEEGSDIL